MLLGLWWFIGHLEFQMWCVSSHSTYYVQVSVLRNINLHYNYNINLYNNTVRRTPLSSVFYSWRNWSSEGNLPKVTQLLSSKGSVQTGALPRRMRPRKPLNQVLCFGPNLCSLNFTHHLHLWAQHPFSILCFFRSCLIAKMWSNAPWKHMYFAHLEKNLIKRHFLPWKGWLHYAPQPPDDSWSWPDCLQAPGRG